MAKKWIEYAKKADFQGWADALGVSPLTARLMRNREVQSVEEAGLFLNGTMADLHDPLLMKDMDRGARLLEAAVRAGEKIAIVSDFDDDGIFAGEILYEGLKRIGGKPVLYTPERVKEGYGINVRIIDEAKADGCSVILTCDNGIAAVSEIAYAKQLGFTVVVTDHHEVQKELPPADALIDPKQKDCPYPCKLLCGAGVAFRLIQVLYEAFGIPKSEEETFYEYAAIATVADVMELREENRLIVKAGLERLRHTEKAGLRALIEVCEIDPAKLSAYHIGFIIGPCFNAVGRLSNVRLAFSLLQTADELTALELAAEIRALNEERKRMTEDGTAEAVRIVEESGLLADDILVVRLTGVHESIVGIIAGRLKEKYARPVFVFTEAGEILKGSGRSVPAFHMMEALLPLSELFERFGGHAMAAGVSIRPENLDLFRREINARACLTPDDLRPVVYFDARLPLSLCEEPLIGELNILAPFGTGNPRPLFARPHFKIHQMRILGKKQNVLKMILSDDSGVRREAVLYNEDEIRAFTDFLREEFGAQEVLAAFSGRANRIDVAFTFYPEINEYQGRRSVQIVCTEYCRIP